ncbi:DUF6090 family protein [Winogradskyella sp. A3E31]|uniref:DUF6090 family protein n=1 Tax=Winogradskyella sp. A3E31 TaxID=3349637 RepID=UPI00398AEFC3
MIKFFRTIRKRTIEDNKSARYFKYAIGEIILVVIGILIALQINTWNENRKAKAEEQKILKALQSDFKVSKTRIEETLSVQTRVMICSKTLINIHERNNSEEYLYFNTHLDSLDYLTSYGTSWYRAEPVTGAYNSLISAGKIDLIRSEDLRHLLAQFAADLDSGFEDQDTAMILLNDLNDIINPFTLKIATNKFRKRLNLNPRKIQNLEISEEFFNNEAFFGKLYLKSILEYNRITRQKKFLEQVNSILRLIEEGLQNSA